MGGRLVANGIRLDAVAYRRFEARILRELAAIVDGRHRFSSTVSYAEKPSFGDLDIVHDADRISARAMTEALRTRFGGDFARYDKDDDSISLALPAGDGKSFQVDFMGVPPADYDFAIRYFAFNDFGNFIGKTAHRFALKFGVRGLAYPLFVAIDANPDADPLFIEDVLVTRDWNAALDILGFDPARFAAAFSGVDPFRRVEDIFVYVSESRLFDPRNYALETLPYQKRRRDKDRPNYVAFLKWIDARFGARGDIDIVAMREERTRARDAKLAELRARFPDFADRLDAAIAAHRDRKRSASKFNGHIVSAATGIPANSIELGAFLQSFADARGGKGEVMRWASAASPEEIEKEILRFRDGMRSRMVSPR